MKNPFEQLGPGALVAAAFIGPGTVTLCTLAGAGFGYSLLWAMLISVLATLFLQEMAARLGVVAQKGLAEVVRAELHHPLLRWMVLLLILTAVVLGNAAYEAGNISGGMLGLETLFGKPVWHVAGKPLNGLSLLIGLCAFVLLWIGNYRLLEKALVSLVVLMSLAFVTTAIITQPNLSEMLQGMFVPGIPEGSLLTILGLIGTTVVPYNLFLHASLVKEKWPEKQWVQSNAQQLARKDTLISVSLGGLVSFAIILSAVAARGAGEITNAVSLAYSLEPLFGSFARYFLSLGLFAAGISSAITAPLAAAYVAQGCLGWDKSLSSLRFRAVWMVVLGMGVVFASLGLKPIEIIRFAQVANGLLLPLIAGILLWIMNRKNVLGRFTNSRIQNIAGVLIVLIALILGMKGIGLMGL